MLADLLYSFRHFHGYSRTKLAKWIGISPSALKRVESCQSVSEKTITAVLIFVLSSVKYENKSKGVDCTVPFAITTASWAKEWKIPLSVLPLENLAVRLNEAMQLTHCLSLAKKKGR